MTTRQIGRPYAPPADETHDAWALLGQHVAFDGETHRDGIVSNVHADGTVTIVDEATDLVVAIVNASDVRPITLCGACGQFDDGNHVCDMDDRPLAGPCVDCGAPIARAIDYPDHPGHPMFDDDDHGPGCDGPLNCTCSLPVGAVV